MATLFARVAVLAHLGRAGGLFTYAVPEGLAPVVGPGSLVRVPFTNRQVQGIVCSLEDTTDLPRVRSIAELLDPVPVVTPHQLRLARWIAEYYAAPLSDVLGAMIPPGLGRKTVYALEITAQPAGARLTAEQRQVLDRVRAAGRILLDEVQRELPEVDVERAAASLVRRGLLSRSAELAPPRVSARLVRVASITEAGLAALNGGNGLARAPRQREVLDLLAGRGALATAALGRLAPGASGQLSALRRKGYVHVEDQQVARSPVERGRFHTTQPLDLSPAQQQAYQHIASSVDGHRPDIFLLHGVTGSGKTEVYLQAVAATIRHGRQVIMMVPEISLTPQAVERVAGRFPGRVAVLHSKLSPGERLDEWQRIRHGGVDVVVGPRSALFAPLARPGLIVVDEEHDPSYKQDASPRYNAHDAAAVLGRLTGAAVVFGSATPDVGTYFAAQSGRIRLLELPDRPVWGAAAARPMPPVEVVDMRQELKLGNRSMFSASLLDALNQTLIVGHQSLLFLNRRGSATVVLCRDCGFVVRCPNCDIPFTYHSTATRLICHRCDKRTTSPRACPVCQSPRIRYLGAGTQRVEEEVARLFPQARVLRWDRDVTGGKEAHQRILQLFAAHEADILVGTQMIAKGLDFPLVTLVGVISADTGLHLPDFRAPERSFQLLTQVAGRAGRASLPSRVIVQTYTPQHYAIQAAMEHDYHRFYREEMSFRRAAHYPPLARLVRFVYAHDDAAQCRRSAENLRSILEGGIARERLAGVEIIGPAPCFMARVKGRYFWQVIVRAAAGPEGGRDIHRLLDYVPPGWTIDVDPVDLL
ncbi:MAG: primosomal protein N' [Chloroflexi bacterium]|nr:primosomal protein N' [Chloroflexota bacterium]